MHDAVQSLLLSQSALIRSGEFMQLSCASADKDRRFSPKVI